MQDISRGDWQHYVNRKKKQLLHQQREYIREHKGMFKPNMARRANLRRS